MRAAPSRFVADAMLGSLSRKLRAFGLDTAYYREGGDDGIIDLARDERRVILTSDGELFSRATSRGLRAILVQGSTDGRRIRSLLNSAKACGVAVNRGAPLCSVCNGALAIIPRRQAASGVPASVIRRHRLFFRCRSCGKYYWKGGHWKKLSNLERGFGQRVAQAGGG